MFVLKTKKRFVCDITLDGTIHTTDRVGGYPCYIKPNEPVTVLRAHRFETRQLAQKLIDAYNALSLPIGIDHQPLQIAELEADEELT